MAPRTLTLCVVLLLGSAVVPLAGAESRTPPPERPGAAQPGPFAPPPPRSSGTGPEARLDGTSTQGLESRRRDDASWLAWTAWYHRRQDAFETWSAQVMAAIVAGDARVPEGLAALSGKDSAERAVAALGGVLARAAEDPWVLGTVAVALARVARHPSAADLLLDLAAAPPGGDAFVEERATLALGLLRRTDPALRLAGDPVDRVRARLFSRYVAPEAPPRVRATAALALGLLGDQPTGDGTPEGEDLGRAATTRRLHAVLHGPAPFEELPASVLIALSLQDPAPGSRATLDVLADLAFRGRLADRDVAPGLKPWGLHAFARLAGAEAVPGLTKVLRVRRGRDDDVARAAVWALLGIGERTPGDVRTACARVVLEAAGSAQDDGVRHAASLALGRLLAADRAEGSDALLRSTPAGGHLLRRLVDGRAEERSFAALAVGLASRPGPSDDDSAPGRAFRKRGLDLLLRGAQSASGTPRHRAACAVGLGFSGAPSARDVLLALASAREAPSEVRAYALVGIGHLGRATPETLRVVAAALSAGNPSLVRIQAAAALGLLRHRDGGLDAPACHEVRRLGSLDAGGQTLLALAPTGREAGVAGLCALLEAADAATSVRVLAATGLGVFGDPEPRSSLDRLRAEVDHLAPTVLLEDLVQLP